MKPAPTARLRPLAPVLALLVAGAADAPCATTVSAAADGNDAATNDATGNDASDGSTSDGPAPDVSDASTPDAPQADASDASTSDGASADVPADLPAADVSADLPAADVSADLPIADVPADLPAADAATDLPAADAPADVTPDVPADLPAADAAADVPALDAPADVAVDLGPPDVTCSAPLTNCGGACVDVRTSVQNCGACGLACPATAMCFNGFCEPVCSSGQTLCTGVCRALATDTSNCGACGRACTAANGVAACVAGVCGIASCAANFDNCDAVASNGCETDLRTTAAHCGRCGAACGAEQACRAGACVSTLPTSCGEILRTTPTAASGRYRIDPDGTGPLGSLDVYCNMTDDGGGWTLVAQMGEAAPPSARGDLRTDRNVATLASGATPTAGEFSSLDLARFNGFGTRWTVRVAVDTANDGRAYQFTYYRPRDGALIGPGIAGANWLGTSTSAALEYLTRSGSVGQSNRVWIPVPGFDPTAATVAVFASRRVASSAPCLDASGENQLCHAPAGGITNEPSLTGTYTAAFSNGDGVAHTWGRRATWWIRDSLCVPERGDCDGNASNGCEAALRDDAANCGACGRACADGQVCLTGVCRRPYPRTCQEARTADPTATSGTFTVDPDGPGGLAPFSVYCDMARDDGGWTLLGAGVWYTANADVVTAPGGANVLLSDARRNALIAASTRLYRLGSGAQRLYILDTDAEFGPARASGGRHYWRSNAASVRCGTAYAQVTTDALVTTTAHAVSCDPSGIGSHNCGSTNGWILWHTSDTYNASGMHPCAFGAGGLPTGGALTDLWLR